MLTRGEVYARGEERSNGEGRLRRHPLRLERFLAVIPFGQTAPHYFSAGLLGGRPLPALFRLLAEQLSLEREDVVEHAVDAPAFEPVLGDHARMLQRAPQARSKRAVDSRLATDLGLLEDLEAAVERKLPEPVFATAAHGIRRPAPRRARR